MECKCGCAQRAAQVRADRRVAVRQFEALTLAAKVGDLRNRSAQADPSWRLPVQATGGSK